MKRAAALALTLLVMLGTTQARADGPKLGPVEFGGRFTYWVLLDEQSRPFPWNSATHSASNRTRLMLDLTVDGTRYGSLYLKGVAIWDEMDRSAIDTRLRLGQGDYLWDQSLQNLWYSLRLFVNQKRFFTYDRIAPLLDDETAGSTGANRGGRVDASFAKKVETNLIVSMLGDDVNTSRSVAYLRAAYTSRLALISGSYLFEDSGRDFISNRATVKAEVAGAYKRVFLALSYNQTGLSQSDFFFPSGTWDWGAYDGDNFSAVLPENGAAFAELRVRRISLRSAGHVNFVWKYAAIRDQFTNDLGRNVEPAVGHSATLFYHASKVGVTGFLRYESSARSFYEQEERAGLVAAVRGYLTGRMDFFLRGGVRKIEERPFNTDNNFIHAALHYRVKKIYSGAHIMWKDLDTIFSDLRLAWDGKLILTPNWGLDWRFIVSRDFNISESVFAQLEYRPSNRVYMTLFVGRSYVGDNPFVLEDPDVDLPEPGIVVYGIRLRGDF